MNSVSQSQVWSQHAQRFDFSETPNVLTEDEFASPAYSPFSGRSVQWTPASTPSVEGKPF